MIKDHLRNYLIAQQNEIKRKFPVILENQDIEAIHDLRVGCKRINSLFFLFEYILQDLFVQKKFFKPFKKMFNLLGDLREVQILYNIVNNYKETLNIDLASYIVYLKQLEGKKTVKFTDWLNNYKLPNWERLWKKITSILDNINNEDIKARIQGYIKYKLSEIDEIYANLVDIGNFHRIRILLKQLRFVLEAAIDSIPDSNKALLSQVKKTEGYLGDWHDRLILLEHLEKFYQKNRRSIPENDYDKLVETISENNNNLLNSAREVLLQFADVNQ